MSLSDLFFFSWPSKVTFTSSSNFDRGHSQPGSKKGNPAKNRQGSKKEVQSVLDLEGVWTGQITGPWRGGSEVRAGKASPVTLRPEEPRSRGTQWGRVLERSSDPCVEGQAEGKETAAWDTGKDSRERGPACLERVTLKRGKGQDGKLG